MKILDYLCQILVMSPLIGSMILMLISKKDLKHVNIKIFNKFAASINIFFITLSLFVICYLSLAYDFNHLEPIDLNWYELIKIDNINLRFGFLLDRLNILMLITTALVSFITSYYSFMYMMYDIRYIRFCSYISFFIFSMFLLIIANNFLQLFFSWELLSFSSYLLINYRSKEKQVNQAAFKVFIINRLGDASLILALAVIFSSCNDFNYLLVFKYNFNSNHIVDLICGLLMISAIVKSAQVPLHMWLLDAMEGPTPASALIHSATMVTVGVFTLLRVYPIINQSPYWLNASLFIGSITALLPSILAVIEKDLKKIMAYSTMSQMGIIMVSIGLGAYSAGIFHLINHAYIKSLFFLSIGVITLLTEEHNIYLLPSGIKQDLPVVYWSILIASLSMSGFPGFSLFFSKELIFSAIKGSSLPFANGSYYLLLTTNFITTFYCFRVLFLIFKTKNTNQSNFKSSSKIFSYSLSVLIFISMFSGFLLFDLILNNKLFSIQKTIIPINKIITDLFHLLYSRFFSFPNIMVIIAFLSAKFLYSNKDLLNFIGIMIKKNFLFFYKILKNQYFFNDIIKLLMMIFRCFVKVISEVLESLFFDKLFFNYIYKIIINCSKLVQKLQTGYLYDYIFSMFTGVLIILLWLFLKIV